MADKSVATGGVKHTYWFLKVPGNERQKCSAHVFTRVVIVCMEQEKCYDKVQAYAAGDFPSTVCR